MVQKLDKSARGAYDAIVYIDGSEVVAEDSNGRKITSGVAGVDDATVLDSIIAGNYYDILLSNHMYVLNGVPITINTKFDKHIYGSGSGAHKTRILQNVADIHAFDINNSERVILDNLAVGCVPGNGDGIHAVGLHRSVLRDINIDRGARYGILLDGCLLNQINRLVSSDNIGPFDASLTGCNAAAIRIEYDAPNLIACNSNDIISPCIEGQVVGISSEMIPAAGQTNLIGGCIEGCTAHAIDLIGVDCFNVQGTYFEQDVGGIRFDACNNIVFNPSICNDNVRFSTCINPSISIASCGYYTLSLINCRRASIRNSWINKCSFQNSYDTSVLDSVGIEMLNGGNCETTNDLSTFTTSRLTASLSTTKRLIGRNSIKLVGNADTSPLFYQTYSGSFSSLLNEYLTFGAWVYVPSTNVRECSMYINFNPVTWPSYTITERDVWVYKSVTLLVPETATRVMPYIGLGVIANSDIVYVAAMSLRRGNINPAAMHDAFNNKTIGSSTGTGSEQTIAHGLAAIPTGCKAWIRYPISATVYDNKEVRMDATSIYPKVKSGLAYTWRVE